MSWVASVAQMTVSRAMQNSAVLQATKNWLRTDKDQSQGKVKGQSSSCKYSYSHAAYVRTKQHTPQTVESKDRANRQQHNYTTWTQAHCYRQAQLWCHKTVVQTAQAVDTRIPKNASTKASKISTFQLEIYVRTYLALCTDRPTNIRSILCCALHTHTTSVMQYYV